MSSELLNNLNSLKSQLNNLEESVFYSQIDSNFKSISHTSEKQNKLNYIQKCQNDIIQLSIRGEILLVSKSTFQNCGFTTIITDEVSSTYGNNEIYIDMDRALFKSLILQLIRFFSLDNKNKGSEGKFETKYKIYCQSSLEKTFILAEIESFFHKEILEYIEFTE